MNPRNRQNLVNPLFRMQVSQELSMKFFPTPIKRL